MAKKKPERKLGSSLKRLISKKILPPPVYSEDAGDVADEDKDEDIDGEVKTDLSEIKGNHVAELIRLKTQVEALHELRKATNERFSRISEEIGELRSMITEKERQISSLSTAAIKASDLVKEVRPEKLMAEVKKQEMRTEALNAKMEGNDVRLEGIFQELKTIKNQISSYRGADEILKLNEEVKGELVSVERVKAITEQHADKVEEIFIHVQKQFAEFQRFSEMAKRLDSSFKEILGEFEDFKIRFSGLVEKRDFDSFREKMNKITIKIDKDMENMRLFANAVKSLKESNETIANSVNESRASTIRTLKDYKERFEEYDNKIKDMLDLVEIIWQKVTTTEKTRAILEPQSTILKEETTPRKETIEKPYREEGLNREDKYFQELKDYIKNCLRKNYFPEKIKQKLINIGWEEYIVDKAFMDLRNHYAAY